MEKLLIQSELLSERERESNIKYEQEKYVSVVCDAESYQVIVRENAIQWRYIFASLRKILTPEVRNLFATYLMHVESSATVEF